jgi:hypothetical protein
LLTDKGLADQGIKKSRIDTRPYRDLAIDLGSGAAVFCKKDQNPFTAKDAL